MDATRRNQELTTLVKQLKEMLAADDMKALFEVLLTCLVSQGRADRGFVLFAESSGPSIRAAHAIDRRTTRSEAFRRVRQIADYVLETGEPFVTSSLSTDTRFQTGATRLDADISIALLPMRGGDRTIGVVYVDRLVDHGAPIEMDAIAVMQDIVDMAGLAVEARFRVRQLRSNRDELRLANVTLERMASSLQEDVAAKSVELLRFERDLDVKNRALRSTYTFRNIVGRSPEMHKVFDILTRVMDYPIPVLVTGESGTGKELIARALHHGGNRADEPFMAINCAAIPENLLESELFGFKRGAFTGATAAKDGLFIAARRGTVFLDEMGEMPLSVQAKLLRVLQESEVRPIGGHDAETVEARIIAATNRNLKAEVQAGRFRQDLYYRLNVVEVRIPPLRERVEDIPALVEHFLRKLTEEVGVPRKRLAEDALQMLMRAPWPGNVRQLENAIKSSALLSRGHIIGTRDIQVPDAPVPGPAPIEHRFDRGHSAQLPGPPSGATSAQPAESARPAQPNRLIRNRAEWEAHDREAILDALVRCGWNKTRAARELHVSRRNLYRKLKRYGIEDTASSSSIGD